MIWFPSSASTLPWSVSLHPNPKQHEVMSQLLLPSLSLKKKTNHQNTRDSRRHNKIFISAHIRNILITVQLCWSSYQVVKCQKHRKAELERIPDNEAQNERFYSIIPLYKLQAHAGPWEKQSFWYIPWRNPTLHCLLRVCLQWAMEKSGPWWVIVSKLLIER